MGQEPPAGTRRMAVAIAGSVLALAACAGEAGGGSADSPSASGTWSQPGGSPLPSPVVPTEEKPAKRTDLAGLSAREIQSRARRAALSARSVRVVGASEAGGLDILATPDASDGTRQAGDTTLRVRTIGDRIYIKADEAYWTAAFDAQRARQIGDRWVTGVMSNPKLVPFRDSATSTALVKQFIVPDPDAEVGSAVIYQGQVAVPLVSSAGTLWVAGRGTPYPLVLSASPEGKMTSEVRFQDWGRKVVIKEPAPRDTIDLADLA